MLRKAIMPASPSPEVNLIEVEMRGRLPGKAGLAADYLNEILASKAALEERVVPGDRVVLVHPAQLPLAPFLRD